MSRNPFDDLPDQIREAIKEMMEKLQSIDPEQLEAMMKQMFGEDFMEKMDEMKFSGGSFAFPLDPKMMKNFESMMRNMSNEEGGNFSTDFDTPSEEEPYYEITPVMDGEGQIIVEMPGIDDVRQINWEKEEDKLHVSAETDDVIYKVDIPVSPGIKLKDIFASVKNSVFILPYTE